MAVDNLSPHQFNGTYDLVQSYKQGIRGPSRILASGELRDMKALYDKHYPAMRMSPTHQQFELKIKPRDV